MKKLLVYFRDYKKECVLGPLFKLLEASFELIVPLVMAAMIDIGVAGRNTAYIAGMSLLLVLLAVIGMVCSITAQYFAAKAAVGGATKLRRALFWHVEGLAFQELDTVGTATLITRLTSDVNQVQNGVNLVLRLFLRSPFIVIGAMVMAFTIDVPSALVFAVAIPLLSAVVFGVMFICIPIYKRVQNALDGVLGITRENLTGSRVIRAFHKQEEQQERFCGKNEALTKLQLFAGRISALMNPMTYLIINGALIALLWTGALGADSGRITQGQVVALVNYMSQILVELVKLASLIVSINKAAACANRVAAVFEVQPSMSKECVGACERKPSLTETEEQSSDDCAVEFSHVGLTYQGAGEEALTEIDFTAKRGETIGIIGGTGSGKSSVVHLIPRFYEATRGMVKVDGRDVRSYDLFELRSKIGVVPQKAVLFAGTIRENLKWGNPNASDEELLAALETAQAREFVEQKEGGLDHMLEQGGRNLSGGQRQRLTIARALVKKPQILILDDSASALDFATDARLRAAIAGLGSEMTVFIVSQRAASIREADKIIVLEDGRIVGNGTHDKLLSDCEVYQEIYESQFQKATGGGSV